VRGKAAQTKRNLALTEYVILLTQAALATTVTLRSTNANADERTTLRGAGEASIGRSADPDRPLPSVTLKASARVGDTAPPGGGWRWELGAQAQRRLSAYEPWELARIFLETQVPVTSGWSGTVALSARDLYRWELDGPRFRLVVGPLWTCRAGAFSLSAGAGAFGQWRAHPQTADGRDLPWTGLYQRADISMTWGELRLELAATGEQARAARWRNILGIAESASLGVTTNVRVGVRHELSNEWPDPETGALPPLQLADSRASRWSLFLQVAL